MKTKIAAYILALILIVLCNTNTTFCKAIDIPTEPEELRLFLLKGYAAAKSVLEDVRIEYQTKSFQDYVLFREIMGPVFIKELEEKKIKIPDGSSTTYKVEEYIQKNGNELWVFLYFGDEAPTQDVSLRTGLIRTKESPRFRVFDGQCILEYTSVKDGITQVGRAILETSIKGLFETYRTTDRKPVKFFGYCPGAMPDDVLSSPQLKIETEPQEIDGLSTYKISAPLLINRGNYDVIYWLSPERSCLPVKMELHHAGGGLQNCMETKEFNKLDDGRWIIKSTILRRFVTKKGQTTKSESGNDTYTIRILELHPKIDDDKIFSTSIDDLPKGIHLIDNRFKNEPEPPSLIGKPLPELKNISIDQSAADANDNMMLICFFDFLQRPSRNCIMQLNKKAQEIKTKGVTVIAVQASKIERAKLDEWIKNNDIAFPVGMVEADLSMKPMTGQEKIQFNWGIKSLPWLILTDKQHIVWAEGFNINELYEKITTLTEK